MPPCALLCSHMGSLGVASSASLVVPKDRRPRPTCVPVVFLVGRDVHRYSGCSNRGGHGRRFCNRKEVAAVPQQDIAVEATAVSGTTSCMFFFDTEAS